MIQNSEGFGRRNQFFSYLVRGVDYDVDPFLAY